MVAAFANQCYLDNLPGTGEKLLVKPDWSAPVPGRLSHYQQKLALDLKYTPQG